MWTRMRLINILQDIQTVEILQGGSVQPVYKLQQETATQYGIW